MNPENPAENNKPSFKKGFKSNWSKRWRIFLGLVIADCAMSFLADGGLSSFSSLLF